MVDFATSRSYTTPPQNRTITRCVCKKHKPKPEIFSDMCMAKVGQRSNSHGNIFVQFQKILTIIGALTLDRQYIAYVIMIVAIADVRKLFIKVVLYQ